MKKVIVCLSILALNMVSAKEGINWIKFDNTVFDRAAKENKVILINLEANWCHWCHVMHDNTYSNTEIIEYLNEHFICVKADQDADPALSQRYKEYGWPATIFLNAAGEDIAKREGYIAPEPFLRLIKTIVKDPTPEGEEVDVSSLSKIEGIKTEIIRTIEKDFEEGLDYNLGGYDFAQKYIDYDSYEYATTYNRKNKIKDWAATTVKNGYNLCDPVWGGVYQYSTHYDWDHLHFEKLLTRQARYIKIFIDDYWSNDRQQSLTKAKEIIGYCDRFLKQDILYGNAQDADLIPGEHSEEYYNLNDKDRLAQGIPRIDTNTYTNSNADMVSALMQLYLTTNQLDYKKRATEILNILLKRKTIEGSYTHQFSDKKQKTINLRDHLSMVKALVTMVKLDHENTKYTQGLDELIQTICTHFLQKNGSFKSFDGYTDLKPQPIVEENIDAGRLLNWYHYFSKGKMYKGRTYKAIAAEVLGFLSRKSFRKYIEPGVLSLYQEMNSEPNSYVLVDRDTSSEDFFISAQAQAPFYSLIYKYAPNDVPKDKAYLSGDFDKDVLFICTSSYCSSPMFNQQDVKAYYQNP